MDENKPTSRHVLRTFSLVWGKKTLKASRGIRQGTYKEREPEWHWTSLRQQWKLENSGVMLYNL